MCSYTTTERCCWTEESSFSWNRMDYFTSPQCTFSFFGWFSPHSMSPYQPNAFIGPSRSDSILSLEFVIWSLPSFLFAFGYTCFVHDLSPGKDKLSTKILKCIFIGYSCIKKGYRCFFPQLQWYIFSSDITFFEGSPFFSVSVSPDEICNLDVRDIPFVIPTHIKPSLHVYQ